MNLSEKCRLEIFLIDHQITITINFMDRIPYPVNASDHVYLSKIKESIKKILILLKRGKKCVG